MNNKNFRQWLVEQKDIFGFDRDRGYNRKLEKESVLPIKPIEIETIMKELIELPLGVKKARMSWHDRVEWGLDNQSGSVLVDVSPVGSFKAFIRKNIIDCEGTQTWICKSIYDFNEHKEKNPTTLSMLLYEELTKADLDYDSANENYKDTEKLAIRLAMKMKLEHPRRVMFFNKMKKMSEHYYVTSFNMRAGGLEAPGHRRIEQFHVHFLYDKKRGLFRSWGNEISSPTSQHKWEPQPSEWDEWIAPSMSINEISNVIIGALMSY
jgi:hypothetical protein